MDLHLHRTPVPTSTDLTLTRAQAGVSSYYISGLAGETDLKGPIVTFTTPAKGFSISTTYVADSSNGGRVLSVKLPKVDPFPAWTIARDSLVNQNTDAAIAQFSRTTADSYRKLFAAVGSTKISQDIGAIGQLTPLHIRNDEAHYYFLRTIGGQQFAFIVTFVKENGQWKIHRF